MITRFSLSYVSPINISKFPWYLWECLRRLWYRNLPSLVQSIISRHDRTFSISPVGMVGATNNVDGLPWKGSLSPAGDSLHWHSAARSLKVPGKWEISGTCPCSWLKPGSHVISKWNMIRNKHYNTRWNTHTPQPTAKPTALSPGKIVARVIGLTGATGETGVTWATTMNGLTWVTSKGPVTWVARATRVSFPSFLRLKTWSLCSCSRQLLTRLPRPSTDRRCWLA